MTGKSAHNQATSGSATANQVSSSQQGLPTFPSLNIPNQYGNQGQFNPDAQQMYIDPEIVKAQKNQALSMLDNHVAIAKDRVKAEYDAQKQAVNMKADHDLNMTQANIDQSKIQSLFALDQQFQQRRMEIEQRAQEQKLQIEATSSQLVMTAEQQRLEREMQEKMAKVYGSMPHPSLMSGNFNFPQPTAANLQFGNQQGGMQQGAFQGFPSLFQQFNYQPAGNQEASQASLKKQ